MQSQVQRMLHSTLTLIFPYAGIIQIRSKGYILSAPGQIGAHPNIFIQFSDSVYSLFRIITEFPI